WRRAFDPREARKEQLQADLARRSETFALLQHKPSASLIAQALDPRTALVAFLTYHHFLRRNPRTGHWEAERRLWAFVLRRAREGTVGGLGALAPVEATLRSGRLAVPSGARHPRAEDAARLRRMLWLPVEKHLADIDPVLIAPDGALTQLPF